MDYKNFIALLGPYQMIQLLAIPLGGSSVTERNKRADTTDRKVCPTVIPSMVMLTDARGNMHLHPPAWALKPNCKSCWASPMAG